MNAPVRRAVVVVGTRPEAIKLAPIVRLLRAEPSWDCCVVSTGQHRDLLDAMIDRLGLDLDARLDTMRHGQSLAALTARLMEGLGELLARERTDVVVVQGDTTSALCGGLAAFYEHVPVAHVEAGLRTASLDNPFPEELNRRLVTRMAHWHFAPTSRAVSALRAEGVPKSQVQLTGNTVIDNLVWALSEGRGRSAFSGAAPKRVLVTLHRRENQGATMRLLADEALAKLAARGDTEIVLPLHPSPPVRAALEPLLSEPAVRIVEPLDYHDFVATLAACDLVLTDSGGVQEEAPSLQKPVLVLRETTERPEAVDSGVALLAGTDPATVLLIAEALLDGSMTLPALTGPSPFGDGRAATRIVERIKGDLG